MSQPATLLERKKEENKHIMLLEAFIALIPYQAKIGQIYPALCQMSPE